MIYSKTGDATPYYAGVAMYLAAYAVLTFIFLIGSLRTNVAFVLTFVFLEISFWAQIAGYLKVSTSLRHAVPRSAPARLDLGPN